MECLRPAFYASDMAACIHSEWRNTMSTATVEFPIHQNVLSFVSAPRKMLIDGRWLKAVCGNPPRPIGRPWEKSWPKWLKATVPMRTAVVDLLDVMLKPARLLWVAGLG